MSKIKVLIADDHTIVRIGLSALLGAQKDIEVVGEAIDGEQAIAEAARLHPDVIIMDIVMPRTDGAEATRRILQNQPGIKVLILTTYGESDGIAHALQAGAAGAMVKTADDALLVSAIRKVSAGERFISEEISQMLSRDPPVPSLSPRQMDILQFMTHGQTNKEIATELGLQKDSVESYIKTLFAKIGASNRAEAVAIALRKQLVKL